MTALSSIMLVFIIAIFLRTPFGFAQTQKKQFSDIMDQYAYEFVLNSCHDMTHAGSEFFLNRTKQLSLGLDMNTVKQEFLSLEEGERLGLSKKLNQLLNSYGYYIGLKECFPGSERAQNIYTIKLIALDLGGTLDASILTVGTGLGLAKALSWTTTKLGWRVFKNKLLKASVLASVVGLSGYQAYAEDKKNAQDIKSLREYMSQQELKILDDIKKEYSFYSKMDNKRINALTDIERELATSSLANSTLTLQALCTSTDGFINKDNQDFKEITKNICSHFRE